MSTSGATITIVDDDRLVLAALVRLVRRLGYAVVAHDAPLSALASYDASVPGCLLLDLAMPDLDGISLLDALHVRNEMPVVVFLSGEADLAGGISAMKHGASDFLIKPVSAAALEVALREAVARDMAAREQRNAEAGHRARLSKLTPREREVLGHLLAGKLNKEVAWDLGVAEKTVKIHRARVMQKMGARSVVDLARDVEVLRRIDPTLPCDRK